MSLFDVLVQPSNDTVMATIVGEGGVGKTSLAALFPKPVFIRVEDGMKSITGNMPSAFPIAQTSDDVLEQLIMLGSEEHDFKTVIIDTVTKLNILIENEIVAGDHAKSINTALGGYGAGISAAAERHRTIKLYCDKLVEFKRMNVVFIAHAETESVDLPDKDPYMRYTIRMNKRSVSHYSDDVDLVAYIKLQTLTMSSKGSDKQKATTDGTRIITCYPTPNHISKNRYGIKSDLVFNEGVNPLAEFVPCLRQNQPQLTEVSQNGTTT
jgi:hypothetical protein